MILTKKVLATVSGRNKSHFENKGYSLPYVRDKMGYDDFIDYIKKIYHRTKKYEIQK